MNSYCAITLLLAASVITTSDVKDSGANRGMKERFGGTSHDGRFDTKCGARGGGKFSGFFCRVSMFQILGNPERFHEKHVEFVAYSAPMDNGHLYLFPTEKAFEQHDLSSAIVVDGNKPATGPERIWIRASGVFSAKYDGHSDHAIGSLSEFDWR